MGRWENEDVSNLDLPDPTDIVRVYLDKNGSETENESLGFAKISIDGDKSIYYILYGRGEIVDPHHVDYNVRKLSYYKFKKVDKEAFDSYVKFLKTKNRLYFTIARRKVMGRT